MVGIVSNSAALFAQRNLEIAASDSQLSIARLSSGNRIIRASDDVSGLAIGTTLSTTVSTLRSILTSSGQANSLLSIADASLQNIGNILQRQKSLATQANSGTLSDNERAFLDEEFQSLVSEINRIVESTTFNGIGLIDGSLNTTALDFTALSGTTNFVISEPTFTGGVLTNDSDLDVQTFGGSDTQLAGLLGDLEDVEAFVNVASNASVNITLQINGVAYTALGINARDAAATNVDFTNSSGDVLRLASIQTDFGQGANVTSADEANIASDLVADLQNFSVFQLRTFSTVDGQVAADNFNGTLLQGLDGSDFTIRSALSSVLGTLDDAPSVGPFTVVEEDSANDLDGKISVLINGVVYSTAAGDFDSVNTNIDTGDPQSNGAGIIRLYREGTTTGTAATEYFSIDLGDITASGIDINSAGAADALETALNAGFASGQSGGLEFQVGESSSDIIAVALAGAGTGTIYLDDDDALQVLSVDTKENAEVASEVLDNAIGAITTLRAQVGALQSRFNFVTAVVSSSIQNTEAARSAFLDVDIGSESTSFATAQVRLQASISVLAQANQIPQNLLKLIG